jgi:hypothetical protein
MLNENDSAWLSRELHSKAMDIEDEIKDALAHYTEPSAIYRPKLYIDGNAWCALYGDNIQDGVCGFGASPQDAMIDFNKSFNEEQRCDKTK